ncbi:NAD(P)-binding protein [Ramicandelaber brevisporus]|nr:NAD(P)-binding protein [Ramicandelaber brevisporus]
MSPVELPSWVKDAPRQDGKLAIVTGASAGLGYQTARFLAERGATVVLACRNEIKTAAVIDKMIAECPVVKREQLVYLNLDLSLMSSVRRFVDEFNTSGLVAKHGGLHLLVNNAGAAYGTQTTTEGFNELLALNCLGPFLLTNLLLRTALAPPNTPADVPVRIVNVASEGHRYSKTANLEKLAPTDNVGYAWSKGHNISFSRHLAKRLRDEGRINITSYSLQPGFVKTEVFRDANFIFKVLAFFLAVPAEDGTKTQFYLSTAPSIEQYSGQYFEHCAVKMPGKWAADESLDAKLWDLSAKWTHL